MEGEAEGEGKEARRVAAPASLSRLPSSVVSVLRFVNYIIALNWGDHPGFQRGSSERKQVGHTGRRGAGKRWATHSLSAERSCAAEPLPGFQAITLNDGFGMSAGGLIEERGL